MRDVFARFAVESVATEIVVTGPGRDFVTAVPDLLSGV